MIRSAFLTGSNCGLSIQYKMNELNEREKLAIEILKDWLNIQKECLIEPEKISIENKEKIQNLSIKVKKLAFELK